MITVSRLKVYQGVIVNDIKHLLPLKNQFSDTVALMAILDHIERMVNYIKTPYFLQVQSYGGEMLVGKKEPPYYSFSDPADQAAFEATFNTYINQDEVIDEFDEITFEISQENYNNLPDDLESNLSGIVNLVVEP